eukprot:TRINITY_DN11117_c0_g1_i2.p1 TRINITY_DN11117_c0_g1~~TRINITY_DN11117_c0_g1_i2.p1  ORF type:complete len:1065 (+),score=303.23 TRINITY_DN11117_c0_g1_i2:50-3244(+)
MVGTIKVRVVEARNLPVMDRSGSADAYVDILFGSEHASKTDIVWKSLDPVWNFDTRIEIPENKDIQDDVLEFKVMDHDMLSDDMIGLVQLDISVLLDRKSGKRVMSGWFPILDPLNGARGELSIVVKLEFTDDINPFRDSSASVQFFASPVLSSSVGTVKRIIGLVGDVVVKDDPERTWKDSFRSKRSSNRARQEMLYEISGKLRRLVGKRVLDAGGNAVLGFCQRLDFEEKTMFCIGHGYGTAVYLELPSLAPSAGSVLATSPKSSTGMGSIVPGAIPPHRMSTSPQASPIAVSRSLDMTLAGPPLGSPISEASPTAFDAMAPTLSKKNSRVGASSKSVFWSQVPRGVILMTLLAFPHRVIRKIGGVVSSKSIKVTGDFKKYETIAERERWWTELREEIRGHAQSMNCNAVVGYRECVSTYKDIILLYATGTAVVWNGDLAFEGKKDFSRRSVSSSPCSWFHIPFPKSSAGYLGSVKKCTNCGKRHVPDVVLATMELPSWAKRDEGGGLIHGGKLIQARVCRFRAKGSGEAAAEALSEAIPFLERQMHQHLMFKMRMYHVNAIFGMSIQYSLGDRYVSVVASGTGFLVSCLPSPHSISFGSHAEGVDLRIAEVQQRIVEFTRENSVLPSFDASSHGKVDPLVGLPSDSETDSSGTDTDSEGDDDGDADGDAEDESSESESSIDGEWESSLRAYPSKSSHPMLVEVDDEVDQDNLASLVDRVPPKDVQCTTMLRGMRSEGEVPVLLQHVFLCQRYEWNEKLVGDGQINQYFGGVIQTSLDCMWNEVERFGPCQIVGLKSFVEFMDEEEHIQVVLEGTVEILFPPEKRPDSDKSGDEIGSPPPFEHLQSPPIPLEQRKPHFDLTRLASDGRDAMDDQFVRGSEDSDEMSCVFGLGHDGMDDIVSVMPRDKEEGIQCHSFLVQVTSLPYIPHTRIKRNRGHIAIHLIREVEDIKVRGAFDELGLFVHGVVGEIQAQVRAQVAATGCNALLSMTFDAFTLDCPEEEEAYTLISVSGDMCEIEYLDAQYTLEDQFDRLSGVVKDSFQEHMKTPLSVCDSFINDPFSGR